MFLNGGNEQRVRVRRKIILCAKKKKNNNKELKWIAEDVHFVGGKQ